MRLLDRIEEWAQCFLGNWTHGPDQLILICDSWDGQSQFRRIEAFVRVKANQTPLMDYLAEIAGLEFGAHDSDMRYGGFYYDTARQEALGATVVPGVWLGFTAPMRYRRQDWCYVSITCRVDDTRFDSCPDYDIVPAHRYKVH
jgi:hypothetical protein